MVPADPESSFYLCFSPELFAHDFSCFPGSHSSSPVAQPAGNSSESTWKQVLGEGEANTRSYQEPTFNAATVAAVVLCSLLLLCWSRSTGTP